MTFAEDGILTLGRGRDLGLLDMACQMLFTLLTQWLFPGSLVPTKIPPRRHTRALSKQRAHFSLHANINLLHKFTPNESFLGTCLAKTVAVFRNYGGIKQGRKKHSKQTLKHT